MSPATRRSTWTTDVSVFCERLAERLRAEGAPHPRSAAAALAARGLHHERRRDFARRLGVDESQLRAIEAGEVPVDQWPAPLVVEAERTGSGNRG